MAARGRSSSGTARLLVLVGILTVLGATFGVGVYTGRIWSARAAVVAAHAPETEPARRGPGRGGRLPEAPAPQLTFYRELTAPLTAPPPPPRSTACRSVTSPRARPRARWRCASAASGRRSHPSSRRADVTTPRPGRVLISEPELRTRIGELGQQIARDYAGETPVLVGV